MCITQAEYQAYAAMLERELIPATGCTEPIAIALASAKAAALLGGMPQRIHCACSGNIVKNVKGVIVPGTGNLRGIEVSAILGAMVAQPELELEVLSTVTPAQVEQAKALLQQGLCTVSVLHGTENLHIVLEAERDGHRAVCEIFGKHTNIVRAELDGQVLESRDQAAATSGGDPIKAAMSLEKILYFAENVALEHVRAPLERQIECNTAISQVGLEQDYGANVGSVLLDCYGDDIKTVARAAAAAGSDARMSGCLMPVVINSGSGNQGLTVSLPVITYARHLGASEDKLYRALVLSNLIAMYQKAGIGALSAYCGAVSAACGSGAAIAYLHGGDLAAIKGTVINTLANVSGIVCDGAKPSCAAKIASSVDAAILGFHMARQGHVFGCGEGLVKDCADATVRCIGVLARDGMRETDRVVLDLMVK